jgi:hypothetical protein
LLVFWERGGVAECDPARCRPRVWSGDLRSPFERESKLGGGVAQSGWSFRCAVAIARVAWGHAMSSVDEED